MRFALFVLLLAGWCASAAVCADQNAPQLDALFDELRAAPDSATAARVESQIWALWLDAPDDVATQQLASVVIAMRAGDYEQALEFADGLVETTPEYAEAWNKRATIHYILGNYDRSVADISETLAREPRHFGAISGLGLVFLRQANLEAALQAFEEVLRISPQSAGALQSAERVRQELARDI